MRTENEPLAPAALFLFAHQDDEFGIFQKIVDELHAGSHVCCAYLTQGGHSNSLAERRNLESLSVLSKLGVSNKDIFFAGDTLRIRDGKLLENLDLASSWIQSWWSNYPQIRSLYVPAWEGGHPDHDGPLHDAATLTSLHRRDPGQAIGRERRVAQGPRDGGAERQRWTATFRAGGAPEGP